MPPKTNKLTVYLIKPEYTTPEEILVTTGHSVAISQVGTFYFDESGVGKPSWITDFFGSTLSEDIKLLSASARGVLLVSVVHNAKTVNFVISFGQGRHMLNPGVIEDRFGLKVVLNSVDPQSLRSIDKTTLGSIPKHTREQIGKDSVAGDFGIDIEQDLISSVTGKSRNAEKLGKTITGKDALSVSVRVDIASIKDFLAFAYTQYLSTEYQKDFGWVDQISDVRNSQLINDLNAALISKLAASDFDRVWMAVPEVVDWVDIKGFRYLRRKEAELVDDLHIKDFLDSLAGETIDIDRLKRSHVFVISSKSDEILTSWSAFQCIYAEMERGGHVYILNNGKWYEIVKGFAKQVNDSFASMEQSNVALLDFAHKDEKAYNEAAASSLHGSCCMDRKVVVHGGGHSSIEFCDIYDASEKRMIHIKQYGGSSHLSYLFAQGAVAGELFVADSEFRKKLNGKLPDGYKLTDTQTRPNASEFEIVYGVISGSAKPLNIPFFSKVALRNAKRRLEGYGYRKVTIKKIPHGTPEEKAV